jgi:hypothetical protein
MECSDYVVQTYVLMWCLFPLFQEEKNVSVIRKQFHGLCEHKNSHLDSKLSQYSFNVVAIIDILLCTAAQYHKGGT